MSLKPPSCNVQGRLERGAIDIHHKNFINLDNVLVFGILSGVRRNTAYTSHLLNRGLLDPDRLLRPDSTPCQHK